MATPGPFMTYSQQSHILALQSNNNPDPREEIIKDLIIIINDQRKSGFFNLTYTFNLLVRNCLI